MTGSSSSLAELASQPAGVLALAAAGQHGVDVHRVDLAGEPGSGRRVGRGALGQQQQHRGLVLLVVGGERDPGRGGAQPRVEPEVTDPGRVVGQQRADRDVRRLLGSAGRARRPGPTASRRTPGAAQASTSVSIFGPGAGRAGRRTLRGTQKSNRSDRRGPATSHRRTCGPPCGSQYAGPLGLREWPALRSGETVRPALAQAQDSGRSNRRVREQSVVRRAHQPAPASAPTGQLGNQQASQLLGDAIAQVQRVIVGQEHMVEQLMVGLLAKGHILLEGVPGVAKTLAVRSFATVVGGDFARLQFTPDLVPSDIVGTRIYKASQESFDVELGPVFVNFVLADEINRAPAKVQSAMLELMAEKQVSIGGTTYPVPQPFIVIATQNPIESEGVYPLPEAQRDRFLLKVDVPYPAGNEEFEILRRMSVDPPTASPVLNPQRILSLQRQAQDVFVHNLVAEYIVRLVLATRTPAEFGLPDLTSVIQIGCSPRATLGLVGGVPGAGPDPRPRLRAADRRAGRGPGRHGPPDRARLRRRGRQHRAGPGGRADRGHGAAADAGVERGPVERQPPAAAASRRPCRRPTRRRSGPPQQPDFH